MMRVAWRRLRWVAHRRTAGLSPTGRALLWVLASGVLFCILNALVMGLAREVPPFQAQFLRYFFGLLITLPWVVAHGMARYRPSAIGRHALRGACHTVGLSMWFIALPAVPLADTTAIGFTTPLFVLLGAWVFFGEALRWERWTACVLGFVGVLIVVAPRLAPEGQDPGWGHLVMLASAPVFAASSLLTKTLVGRDSIGTITLWQSLTITAFSLPAALWVWTPITAWQWAGFALCGALGTAGHYCVNRSLLGADISATQSLKFLDLIWATLLGWALYHEWPTGTTIAGGLVISAATIWAARREAR